jgi:hypothetical protein
MVGRAMVQVVSRWPLTAGLCLDQSMWDLLWTEGHWGHIFLQVLLFSSVNIIPPVLHIQVYYLGDEL